MSSQVRVVRFFHAQTGNSNVEILSVLASKKSWAQEACFLGDFSFSWRLFPRCRADDSGDFLLMLSGADFKQRKREFSETNLFPCYFILYSFYNSSDPSATNHTRDDHFCSAHEQHHRKDDS